MAPRAPRKSLHELLSEPFGPYWDEDILTADCSKTTLHHPLILQNLQLTSQGRTLGLDQTEPTGSRPDQDRILEGGVLFRGILKIDRLSWLTETAHTRLEEDLRQRDIQSRISNGSQLLRGTSTLSLRFVYNEVREKIKVLIQGKKNLTVGYFTSSRVPDGLQLASEHMGRVYSVYTMDAVTYKLSRTYLSRYRMLHVMKTLLNSEAGLADTPLDERTPKWFADLYLQHMAKSPAARTRRIVYDSDDSDINVNVSAEGTNFAQLRDGRSRTLRYLPCAEILSLMARHRLWFIEDQKRSSRDATIIDVNIWKRWSGQVDEAREDMEVDDSADEMPAANAGRRRTLPLPRRLNNTSVPGSAPDTSARGRVQPRRSTRLLALDNQAEGSASQHYDPDFSPSSSSESPWESDSSYSCTIPPHDPEIDRLIPPAFAHPPALGRSSWRWHCEFPNCNHVLDMLNLREEDISTLHPEETARLCSARWSIGDKWVQTRFLLMISSHRNQHLDELGIEVKFVGKKQKQPMLCWKNPTLNRPWQARHETPS